MPLTRPPPPHRPLTRPRPRPLHRTLPRPLRSIHRGILRLPRRLRITLFLLLFLLLLSLFHSPSLLPIPRFLRRTPRDPFAFDLGFDLDSDYDSTPFSSLLHQKQKQSSKANAHAQPNADLKTDADHAHDPHHHHPRAANAEKRVLAKHLYRHDGLLEANLFGVPLLSPSSKSKINSNVKPKNTATSNLKSHKHPEQSHPIHDLIVRAEKDWAAKLGRASTNLEEAVREYRRRYGRRPPRGFEVWWTYVQTHTIPLPDEYDQIYHDLEPFWGLDPALLREIQREAEEKVDSYTVGKDSGRGGAESVNGSNDNANGTANAAKTNNANDTANANNTKTISPSTNDITTNNASRSTNEATYTDNTALPKTEPRNKIDVLTYAFTPGQYSQLIQGSTDILSMLRVLEDELNEVGAELPDFRMVISPHDGPNRMNDWGVREALLDAVEGEEYLSEETLPIPTTSGWLAACAPHTLAHLIPYNLSSPPPPPSHSSINPNTPYKTFIHTHPPTMSPCTHPRLLHTHGQFLSHELGPAPQRYWVPEFGYCSTVVHHNVRIPVPYGWVEDVGVVDVPDAREVVGVNVTATANGAVAKEDAKAKLVGGDMEWEEKTDTRLLWRGSNTGMYYDDRTWWKESQRVRLVRETNSLEGMVRVLHTATVDDDDDDDDEFSDEESDGIGAPRPRNRRTREILTIKELPKSLVNPLMMDIAFAGDPIACSEKVCKELNETHRFVSDRMGIKDAARYKYIIDVDGNGWSGRFKRLMTSNSLIFKSTIYPEWYTDRIAPWVHYVPIQVDLSDLYDALFFFRGDENGDGVHDDLAKKIAVEGRKWSKTFWRKEDITAYFYRLILEYARLMSDDRDAMSYHGPGAE